MISRGSDQGRMLASRALLILAGCALLLRLASLAEPLGIDQSLWASAVYGMSHGQQLYVDVWEQRPPGIYLTYLLGFELFGWSEGTVAVLDMAAAVLTTGLVWMLGRRLGDDLIGALAAFLYAALTIPAGLFGYGGFLERSVCETFITVAVGLAAYGATRLRDGKAVGWAMLVGAAGAIAVLFKPNAGLYLPAVVIWYIAMRPASVRMSGVRLREATFVIVGAAIPLVLTVIWLWQAGALDHARVAVVDFNRWYVAEGLGTRAHLLAFAKAAWLRIKTDPIWLGGAAASMLACWTLARRRTLPPLPALAMCWGAAAVLVIFVNGIRLFNSYFIQAHAPLCLMAAWALAERSSTRRGLVARVSLVVLMAALLFRGPYLDRLAARTWDNWRALRGETDRMTFLEGFGGYANSRGYSARANQELADYIREHTSSSERIFLFGVNGAGVYFLSERLTAHRFLRANFFFPADFPDPAFTVEAVTRDLALRRPRYVIFENLHATSAIGRSVSGLSVHPSVAALLLAYEFETQIEDFALYRLRD